MSHVVCLAGGADVAVYVVPKKEVVVFWGLVGEGFEDVVESFVVDGDYWVVN